VRPREFDTQRFTKGAGATRFFAISALPAEEAMAKAETGAPSAKEKGSRRKA